jgi:hypothetical protein
VGRTLLPVVTTSFAMEGVGYEGVGRSGDAPLGAGAVVHVARLAADVVGVEENGEEMANAASSNGSSTATGHGRTLLEAPGGPRGSMSVPGWGPAGR